MKKLLTTVGIALLVSVSHAKANSSWFVYCEGVENGQTTAYLTNAIYTHYESLSNKTELENAAVERLAQTRGAPIYGCSGVSFRSKASADQAKERTMSVHERFGNKVVTFDMAVPQKLAANGQPNFHRTRLSRGRPSIVNTTFASGADSR